MENACNQDCVMCPIGASGAAKTEMPPELIDRILDSIEDPKALVALTAGGEPLLAEGFDHAVEGCLKRGLAFLVFTNGIALDRSEPLRRAAAKGEVHIRVSMDAATPETYSRLRPSKTLPGPAAFSKVLGNIRALAALREEGAKGLRLHGGFVMMRANIRELPAFADLCASLGMDSISPLHLYAFPPADPNESLYYRQPLSDRMCAEALDRAFSEGLSVDPDIVRQMFFAAELRKRYSAEAEKRRELPALPDPSGGARCPKPWTNLIVRPDGGVYPCCVLLHPGSRFGNLLREPLGTVWSGEGLHGMREAVLRGAEPHVCTVCRVDQKGVPGDREAHFPPEAG